MKTFNTIVTSKEVEVLNNVAARCPYECVELEAGRYGFMDNANGDVREYFALTLGYECSNYEAFDFEYFDEPQKVEEKPSFYTPNGWAGSNYDRNLSGKEIAAKVRAYVKENYPDFKFSIRSKWGMQADSIYITLISGPVPAIMEGNSRNYESSISGFGDQYKDLITPEVLAMMNNIYGFVSSYRFDDSDGMIDYFDTNLYAWMYVGECGKPYVITEKKAKKAKPAKDQQAEPAAVSPAYGDSEISRDLGGFEIVDYSEKAIAVFGDTKAVKDRLKELGGRFNPSLKYGEGKRAGWIFSKKQADKVRAMLAPAKEAAPARAETPEQVPAEAPACHPQAYGDSEISPKDDVYTNEMGGLKVKAYFTKKTDLEEMIDNEDARAIRKTIEAKEKALKTALENVDFYKKTQNLEFADNEQARADKLRRDLSALRASLDAIEEKADGVRRRRTA